MVVKIKMRLRKIEMIKNIFGSFKETHTLYIEIRGTPDKLQLLNQRIVDLVGNCNDV